jgi:hypothetical protein
MGRVLAGIVADSCGWHDPFGGVLNAEDAEKYGAGRYQDCVTASTATASITCWWRWANGISAWKTC